MTRLVLKIISYDKLQLFDASVYYIITYILIITFFNFKYLYLSF